MSEEDGQCCCSLACTGRCVLVWACDRWRHMQGSPLLPPLTFSRLPDMPCMDGCSDNAGEETRWTMQSKEFDSQIQRLTGDCAVASAFVSYLGPFNKEFRELLMSRDFYGDCIKLNIPVTQNIEVG